MIQYLCFALALAVTFIANAGEAPKLTAIDPEKAGLDFKIQGEYEGQLAAAGGKPDKLGAQIIATGNGTFHSVYYPGGLPGAGWDGKTKIEKPGPDGRMPFADGKTEGDKVVFTPSDGNGWGATISGEVLSGKSPKGETFQLKKVLRESPTAGAKPPAGALVLFDGTDAAEWNGHMDARKLLSSGATSKKLFRDFTLHVEFRTPFKPNASGQERGNSGVYLQYRYEVQVLDTFGLRGADNECGGLYHQATPLLNMCYPPLSWQTYDIDFTAARYDDAGKKIKNAIITVKHNGVLIHDHKEITASTGSGKPEGKEPGPIYLQEHGNPVFYRNVWVIEKRE